MKGLGMTALLEAVPTKIFGMAAHPLIVHGAVVLVPSAAIALIGVGWNPPWRRRYYLPIMLVAVCGAAAAFLAAQSGESLQQSVEQAGRDVGDHPQRGDIAFVGSGRPAPRVAPALCVRGELGPLA